MSEVLSFGWPGEEWYESKHPPISGLACPISEVIILFVEPSNMIRGTFWASIMEHRPTMPVIETRLYGDGLWCAHGLSALEVLSVLTLAKAQVDAGEQPSGPWPSGQ